MQGPGQCSSPHTHGKSTRAWPWNLTANHKASKGADIRSVLMGLRMHRPIVGDLSVEPHRGIPIHTQTASSLLRPAPTAPNSQLNKYGYEKIYRQNLANAAEAKESGCKILHLRRAAVSCCERWDEMICSAQAAP